MMSGLGEVVTGSSRQRASSRVRPCGRGAAAATSCCSSSATVVRAPLPLLGCFGLPLQAEPRGGAPAHTCGLAVGASR